MNVWNSGHFLRKRQTIWRQFISYPPRGRFQKQAWTPPVMKTLTMSPNWNENEHFRLVLAKTMVLEPKTSSLNPSAGDINSQTSHQMQVGGQSVLRIRIRIQSDPYSIGSPGSGSVYDKRIRIQQLKKWLQIEKSWIFYELFSNLF